MFKSFRTLNLDELDGIAVRRDGSRGETDERKLRFEGDRRSCIDCLKRKRARIQHQLRPHHHRSLSSSMLRRNSVLFLY